MSLCGNCKLASVMSPVHSNHSRKACQAAHVVRHLQTQRCRTHSTGLWVQPQQLGQATLLQLSQCQAPPNINMSVAREPLTRFQSSIEYPVVELIRAVVAATCAVDALPTTRSNNVVWPSSPRWCRRNLGGKFAPPKNVYAAADQTSDTDAMAGARSQRCAL